MELLLTVEQAAERLQIQPNTVRRHLSSGLLRGIKRGRQWRIPASALTESVNNANAPSPATDNPLARALAMVQERDARIGPIKKRIAGVNDVATEIREMREAQTP